MRSAALLAAIFLCSLVVAGAQSSAQTIGAGLLLGQMLNNSANNACNGCQNTNPSVPNYCQNIQCSTEANGGFTVSGMCGAPGQCRGTEAQGLDGVTIALGLALQAAGLINTLRQQHNATNPPPGSPTDSFGCTTFYSVRQPSSDPCAIYNPVSDTIAATPFSSFEPKSDSEDAQARPAPVSSSLLDLTALDVDETGFTASTSASTTSAPTDRSVLQSKRVRTNVEAQPEDLTGIVRVGQFGTTFVANVKNSFTQVAGFFGSPRGDGAPTSLIGRLCALRPWFSSSIAKLIPPSFFDAICTKLGVQVGVVHDDMETPRGFVTAPPPKEKPKTKVVRTAPPEVDIWAEPEVVRLGTRTKIFWTSKNADSCLISGPNFTETSLAGGGATVPITGPTVYTIECTAGNRVVTNSVTVILCI